MGRVCSTHENNERSYYTLGRKLEGKNHIGVYGMAGYRLDSTCSI
jgi:hypothetical protein